MQRGVLILAVLGVIAVVDGLVLLWLLVAEGFSMEWLIVAAPFPAILLVVYLLGGWMTVIVEVDELRLSMGIGLIRRSIPLSEVESCQQVRNSWWYGWGIRLTPRGWLWNVSGLDAVELNYRSGKHFRIGTDEPRRLRDAIEAALSNAD
jgi:hypothetical protein